MRYDYEMEADADRDFPRERRVTQDGKTVCIYATDPHGFWRIKLEKQKVQPKEFEGSFTSIHEAEKAVLTYFNSQKVASASA